ncbi:MAG: fructose-1,6-bisphosphatase [Oscillospiraceae bacterium]|nr:fructose-1,6-bisphosphatase [Oscillospiraceae bacterium]
MEHNEYRSRDYLQLLAQSYPNSAAVCGEIINLSAILNLPKGTEHFMSDLHGEHEAYLHIRQNASGVIRKKVDQLFGRTLTASQRAELATLIYYPEEKLDRLRESVSDLDDWYAVTLVRLIEVLRLMGSKYTRSKVRKRLAKAAGEYTYILDELLHADMTAESKQQYYENILDTIISIGSAEQFIIAVCSGIKNLVIDHLHIVGDVYDRGPRADIIMDELMQEASLDIQWGNHDALWMGAAAGSRTCIATVLNNSITYKNLDVIEIGYGISLRPLALFANDVYKDSDISIYMPKGTGDGSFSQDDDRLVARMHKAIGIIQFKLEGQTIRRNPDFGMEARLLLDKIDFGAGTVAVGDRVYPMRDCDLPTVDPADPYALTPAERDVMRYLKNAFMRSEKLQRHVRFLYEKGGIFTVFNKNLLFHGCVPMNEDGSFMQFPAFGNRSGKALMEYCEKVARQGFFAADGSEKRQKGKDFLWFLWCGKDSPLNGRKKITTFERLFVEDRTAWEEPKNAYYSFWDNEDVMRRILAEFSLGEDSHIINGHVPVKQSKGEQPLKAGGKLIVIDGGFCRAYQPTTGIAGYTLIYNADGIRISAHQPFTSVEDAIDGNVDILSETVVSESASSKIKVRDMDDGAVLQRKIDDLKQLLAAYEAGEIKERSS